MRWLDPGAVPTLGDWFRTGGYEAHYRGTLHISHADLPVPSSDDDLAASDDDGRLIVEAVEACRAADRLDGYGCSGWIGREPHGAAEVARYHRRRARCRAAI
jgi:arylsulfatase A-like enzyme